jgi:hypothetical protein
MAAPKNPNVAKAHAARRAQGDLTASNRLAASGHLVLTPVELTKLSPGLREALARELAALKLRCPESLTRERQTEST